MDYLDAVLGVKINHSVTHDAFVTESEGRGGNRTPAEGLKEKQGSCRKEERERSMNGIRAQQRTVQSASVLFFCYCYCGAVSSAPQISRKSRSIHWGSLRKPNDSLCLCFEGSKFQGN